MPILNDINLDQIDLPNSHYGYSATRIEDLGATEYTIATIVCDVSGSTASFTFDMESAITRIVQSCKYSPRADNLLLRLVVFDDTLSEVHGFKLLENCNLADYGGVLRPGGSTALYEAAENAVSSVINYGQKLSAGDFRQRHPVRHHRRDGQCLEAPHEKSQGGVRQSRHRRSAGIGHFDPDRRQRSRPGGRPPSSPVS